MKLEAWAVGDHRWFKRSTRKKCLWQETYISYNNNNNNNNNRLLLLLLLLLCTYDISSLLENEKRRTEYHKMNSTAFPFVRLHYAHVNTHTHTLFCLPSCRCTNNRACYRFSTVMTLNSKLLANIIILSSKSRLQPQTVSTFFAHHAFGLHWDLYIRNITVFYDATPCNLVKIHSRFFFESIYPKGVKL